MQTNIRKALAFAGIATLSFSSLAHASQIGTGSVIGSPGLSAPVNWNDTFPGTATGIVNGVTVDAVVAATLNMVISTGSLNLGTLSSTAYSTGTLSVELGTNAANGASVTARSFSGGLQNLSNSSIIINDAATDGTVDSYRFASAILATSDSTISGFTQTAALSSEVDDTTTNHTVYTSNKPQALSTALIDDDFTLSVSAKPNAQTAAGNYRDKVVITVIGNF